MANLISLGEWAKKNGIDPATARQRAGRGAFETAFKLGRNWVIEEDEKLVDHRKKYYSFGLDEEMKIAIIMETGSTESEAKKHLKNGATIYDESEKQDFIENCIGCMMDEEEAEECWEQLEKVTLDGINYRVDFTL